MKVVIIGGGIGGIAAAAFLQQAGVEADVYEQAPELAEVGAGIVLAPNAVRLLRRLGLADALAERAVRVETAWEFRRWEDGRVLLAQDMAECQELYGEAAWLIHRADLLSLLLSAVDPSRVHLGMRVDNVGQDERGVRATFVGSAATAADILIAADGIRSSLRSTLTHSAEPRDSGLCAWRAMVPVESLPEFFRRPVQTLWLGPGRHLVHYPVSGGAVVNVVAFSPVLGESVESWTAQGDPDDFAAEFAGWEARLGILLKAVDSVGRWAVMDREPIDNYVFGRIALLGDAAHPMLPFFAQGAGQAIEDAAAITTCLTSLPDPREALKVYNSVRVPRTAQVQNASHGRAAANHLPDGSMQIERDRAFASQNPLRHSDWLYGYDAQEAVRRILSGSSAV